MTSQHAPPTGNSLRALRLEQIAIWGAAAHSEPTRSTCGGTMFPERRASLFETGPTSPRSGLARRSSVRLDGPSFRLSLRRRNSSAPDPKRRSAVGSKRRPVVSTDSNIRSSRASSRTSTSSALSAQSVTSTTSKEADEESNATRVKRERLAARTKSAMRSPSTPLANVETTPRARSFFHERRPTETPRNSARASIRLLGRYARTRSARIPLFRPRVPLSSREEVC